MQAGKAQVCAPPTIAMGEGVFARREGTALWWLTNAGFLINAHGVLVMIDPAIMHAPDAPRTSETGHTLLVDLPLEATQVPRLDAVCYTHADYDHFAPATARELLRTGALFIAPPPVARELSALGLPPGRVQVAKAGDHIAVGEVTVTITPADHPWQVRDPARFGPPWGPEDCCGYRVTTPEGVIWHPGDTRLVEEHLRAEGVDVLLLDVSRNNYHLGVADAARLANATRSPYLLPHHYGSYEAPEADPVNPYNGDPADVAQMVEAAARRFHVLAPGEEFVLRRGRPSAPEA